MPQSKNIFTAPLIWIEVLSKDDRLRGIRQRVDHYLRAGAGSTIRVRLTEVFAELDS